ncbi:MAG TPA: hypothetical protein VH083_03420 [Myxococcales bacterium]|jgi:hypothetical protein|nr:hypothetical protein [Myxococcales bacterium]
MRTLVQVFVFITVSMAGCMHSEHVGGDSANAQQGDFVIELREATFDGRVLKGRVALQSRRRGFALEPRATLCEGLFQLVAAHTCNGRDLSIAASDCVGGESAVIDREVFIPPGMWLGSNRQWYLSEHEEKCIEVTIQVFFDGRSAKRPGPRLNVKAIYESSVSNITGN